MKENKKQDKQSVSKGTTRRGSLQGKILIPFLILIIATGGVLSVVSYLFSVENTSDELAKSVESEMVGMNHTFDMFFDKVTETLERLSSVDILLDNDGENTEDVQNLLEQTYTASNDYSLVYTGTTDGKIIDYPKEERDASYNVTERDWYIDAVEEDGDIVWTEPYEDAATGETIITVSKAYYQADELAGVVAADIQIDALLNMTNEVEIGETGYAAIFGETGDFIAHPDEALIGENQSNESFYKKIMNAGEHGLVEYKLNGDERVTGFAKNDRTGWVIAGTVPLQDFKDKAQAIFIPIAITLVIILALSVIASLFVTRKITAPIKTVMNRMRVIAEGDLSHPPLEKTSNGMSTLN